MKISYDKEADALYIKLSDRKIKESEEIQPGVIVDYSHEGQVVGIEVLRVSQQRDVITGLRDLSQLEAA